MAKHFSYYDPARQRDTFPCPQCSWQGTAAAMTREWFEALMDFSCPKCDTMILIVSYPTLVEIEEAASRGNAEAQSELARIRQHSSKRDTRST
jgi:hypothetical protein